MLKRIFNTSSPWGIALTVAGVVLALSPEARKATRRLLVKGTGAVLGAVDQVKHVSTNITQGVASVTDKMGQAIPSTAEISDLRDDTHTADNNPQYH